MLLGLVAAAMGGGWMLAAGRWQLPPDWDPWAPLDVSAAPNWLTPFKFQRARDDPARCFAAIERGGLDFDRVPDRVTGEGCGFTHALRLRTLPSVELGTPTVLSCQVALSLAMWERHGLQPAARAHLQSRIVRIDHLGSYACRNVNTGEGSTRMDATGRRSRHATADALDVSGFRDERGRQVLLRREWRKEPAPGTDGPSPPAAGFLRAAHESGCRYFTGVLGPDYNAVHADHFHLEVGGWRTCR